MSSFQQKPVPSTNVEDLDSFSAPVLLDVRDPDEWEAGHAPDAWFWPLGRLDQVRAELPLGQTIVCVCRSGARSARATEILRSWGFDAVNLEGGMKAWAAAGRPVERDNGSPGTVI
ncbi:MAG: rhodanese-like domain-containing protein [Acidimicrobiia bacterium]